MEPSSGSPATKWATLARIRDPSIRATISHVSAVCGVMMQFGADQSGWPSGSGSGLGHIQARRGDVAVVEGIYQGVGVYVASSGDVDQPGLFAHSLQLGPAHDLGRVGGQRQGQEYDEGVLEGLLQAVDGEGVLAAPATSPAWRRTTVASTPKG